MAAEHVRHIMNISRGVRKLMMASQLVDRPDSQEATACNRPTKTLTRFHKLAHVVITFGPGRPPIHVMSQVYGPIFKLHDIDQS